MRQLIASDRNLDGEINPLDLLSEFNWTHEQLAAHLRIHSSTVSKWSRGLHQPSRRLREDAYKLKSKLS